MNRNERLNFKTNFSKPNLLRNYPIKIIWNTGRSIEFNIPAIGEMYGDMDMDIAISLLRAEPKDFEKDFVQMGFTAETSYELITGAIRFSKYYSNMLTVFLEKYIVNCKIKNGAIYIDNEELKEEEYNLIRLLLLIGLGLKTFSDYIDLCKKEEDLSQLDEISREIKQKLENAKKKVEQAKAAKSHSNNIKIDIETIFLSIMYEIPSITLSEMFNWNYFTLYWYFDYIPTLVNNKIQTIAAGNGIAKQFKHFAYNNEVK